MIPNTLQEQKLITVYRFISTGWMHYSNAVAPNVQSFCGFKCPL